MPSDLNPRYRNGLTDGSGRGLSATSINSNHSSSSNMSTMSANSGVSATSATSLNETQFPQIEVDHLIPRFVEPHTISANGEHKTRGYRSHSHDRGRSMHHNSSCGDKLPHRKSRSRPRTQSQGPLHHILSNFKPFSRDSNSKELRKDLLEANTSRSAETSRENSFVNDHRRPLLRSERSERSEKSEKSDNRDKFDRSDKSDSSIASSTMRILPALSNLVPGYHFLNDPVHFSIDPFRPNSNNSGSGSGSGSERRRSSQLSMDGSIVESTNETSTESLRHVDLPAGINKHEKLCFLRVYRADGTFGTMACPMNVTSEQLVALATRKFFIDNSSGCRLVALYPNRVQVLDFDTKPVLLIHNLLVMAGYEPSFALLNQICRGDTTFLCRIVLAHENEPLRVPEVLGNVQCLDVSNTDILDAPSKYCPDPDGVITMNVSYSAFRGTSAHFKNLKRLRLRGVFLYMSVVPATLASQMAKLCSNLTELDISGNGLKYIGRINRDTMPNLRQLDIRGNQVTELPSSLEDFPFLRVLLCGTNCLTEYSCWNPSLEEIDISYNQINRIDLSIEQARAMTDLLVLQLSANDLRELPESFKSFPSLVELDVRHNAIYDPKAAMVPSLTKLIASHNYPVSLKLNKKEINQDSQDLQDPDIKDIMPSIKSLDLKNTIMPYSSEFLFKLAPRLRVLDLRNNNLTKVPVSIAKLRMLEELYIASNSLIDLPVEIFALPELRVLDVHGNKLRTLPGYIWLAPKLGTLNIASNQISQLPAHPSGINASRYARAPIKSLITCDNHLNEECFAEIVHLRTLIVLDLSYNYITEIPGDVFSQLPNLEEVYLSGNALNTLPNDDFDNASQLRVLHLAANNLHALPPELSKASKLEVLDVSANKLRYNVSNWPFDWNWRWNTELRYLNLSYNKRLEIRRSPHLVNVDGIEKPVDLADFCVLPKLHSLGLTDVTLTTNSVPFQTENCRVRTFGSDLGKYKVGIADTLGYRPLAINDMVFERFRNEPDETLIALFDGHDEEPGQGNKISQIAQQSFASILKTELQAANGNIPQALRRSFLALHREVGNAALLSPTEIMHSALGHRCTTAKKLTPRDWQAGTGATVLYICKTRLYIASVGGARVILSRADGSNVVLSKPLPPVGKELDRIRSSGGIVNPRTSLINFSSKYPRMIGCYTSGTVFNAVPSIFEYDIKETLDVSDNILIGSGSIWSYLGHDTASAIIRSECQDPMLAAIKLRNYAMAYGLRDRAMAIVIGHGGTHSNGSSVSEGADDDSGFKKRRYYAPVDSTLAHLGSEVSPPSGEVTMVFTDIRNSTQLWETYPALMREAIKTHNSLMRRSIRLMEGYEVKTEGDAFIISFHSPTKALLWCLTVQQHLLTAEWPPGLLDVDECAPVYDGTNLIFRGLSVRMGIHCGRPVAEPDPVTRRMDYFGPMVNRTARISGIALGGQISVSEDFLTTLNRDLHAHKAVQAGESPATAYYWVSPPAAEALERSGAVLDHTEYTIDELGELKLRGIENAEHIYNFYPKSLDGRRKWYAEQETSYVESEEERIDIQQNMQPSTSGSASAAAATLGLPSVQSLINVPLMNSNSSKSSSSLHNKRPQFSQYPVHPPSQSSLFTRGHSVSTAFSSTPTSPVSSTPMTPIQKPCDDIALVSRLDDYRLQKAQHPIQNLAQRLEALCVSLSTGESATEYLKMIQRVEPVADPVEESYSIWTTRVENAVARIEALYYHR